MAIRHMLITAPFLLALLACETAQENPNYQYSSTYGGPSPHALAQNSRHPGQSPTQHVQSGSDQLQAAVPVRYVNTAPGAQTAPAIHTASHGTSHVVSHQQAPLANTHIASTSSSNIDATYTRVDSNCVNGGVPCQTSYIQSSSQQAVITPAYTSQSQNNDALLYANHQNEPVDNVFSDPLPESSYTPSLTENTYSADSIGTPGYEAIRRSQNANLSGSTNDTAAAAPAVPQPVPQAQTAELFNTPGPFTEAPAATAQQPLLPVATPQDIPTWPQAQTHLGQNHIVKPGDTVYSLSRSICSSVSTIQSMNGLDQNFSIKVGQTLDLPPSAC